MPRDSAELNKKIDDLGTEFRRLFMIVASGLFIGSLIKGISLSQAQFAQNWGLIFIGASAIIVLANVLRAKHRLIKKRDELGIKEMTSKERLANGKYLTSVAFVDAIALFILVIGIIFSVF